jgi:DNA-binding PadR family transcriptional regulator
MLLKAGMRLSSVCDAVRVDNYDIGVSSPPRPLSTRPIPLSYVILAAIGERGASTPELVDMLSRGQMYWTSSPSQIYAEPKRLLTLGWITSEKQPGKTRSRTVYHLTDVGREAVRDWLRAPAGFPRLQHEASVRLFAGDMIDDEEIIASLEALRADIAAMSEVVDRNIARAPGLPHRTRYMLLHQDLGRRLLQAHAEWLDAVEAELAPGGRGSG